MDPMEQVRSFMPTNEDIMNIVKENNKLIKQLIQSEKQTGTMLLAGGLALFGCVYYITRKRKE